MIAKFSPLSRRIVAGDQVGPLAMAAISGLALEIPASDRLTHLQFRRFAGCPVCDLHLRSIARRHAEIEAAGIREIVLFHSSPADLQAYAADLPFPLVADPGRRLYARFGVETGGRALLNPRAWPYIALGILRSSVRVMRRRQPMPPIQPESGSLGLPADFLIGADGIVIACKYGEHAYDQWSAEQLIDLGRTCYRDSASGKDSPER